ncbi:hypothetical protein Fot_37290 [Forsythia ovata]|uniref:Uncharacterized protein n=1 Tax=Forsythia ovata TaxID=205694 RepID=A0ABD1RYK3_9LAMI
MKAKQIPNHQITIRTVKLGVARELISVSSQGPDPSTQLRSLKQSQTCTLACMPPIKRLLLDKQVLTNLKIHTSPYCTYHQFTDIVPRTATYRHWQNKEPKRRIEPPLGEVKAGIARHFSPTSCVAYDARKLEIAGQKKR